MEKKALGRGLEALIPTEEYTKSFKNQSVIDIDVNQIMSNHYQPRSDFPEQDLVKLADSVKQTGLLQPIIVRRKGDGSYELVAGERRWRAAKLAGLSVIPASVRNCNDEQAVVLALIENLQRQDLNPVDTARAYNRVMNEFGMTQDDLAQQLGKDRSSVANMARLVHLPAEIQKLLKSGAITTGHAKVILGLASLEEQVSLGRRIVEGQLSVRQTEKLVEDEARSSKAGVRRAPTRSYPELEVRIQKRLGTKVTIQKSRRGGRIVIHYFSQPELERVLETLLA